jgi:hypothetical protein
LQQIKAIKRKKKKKKKGERRKKKRKYERERRRRRRRTKRRNKKTTSNNQTSQNNSTLFWRHVALGFSEHFVAYLKFLDTRRAQEWRIEMKMERPFWVRQTVAGCLMKARRVGEVAIENGVVGPGDFR